MFVMFALAPALRASRCRRYVVAATWALAALLSLPFPAAAQSVSLQQVLSGLNDPLYVTNADDGTNRLFVVERDGIIRVKQPASSSTTVFLDIRSRVLAGGERGLLGLTFHPNYPSDNRFFVNYTRKPNGATVVAEYRVSSNPNVAATAERVVIVIAQPFANHNGGMIEFGPDGFLYIGMGDGGDGNDPGNRAQNLNDLLGKILRLNVNPATRSAPYTSPSTNPYFGSTPGRDEIYAVGMRNPWRFSFDRANGDLLAGDVGQGVVEEVDNVELGGNYGWRVLEGTKCTGLGPASCSDAKFIPPVVEYEHTGGRCSITGGYVYRGTAATVPSGTYLFGDFCTGEIFMRRTGAMSVLLDSSVNISSFGEDEAGEIYVVGLGGTVHRIVARNTTRADLVVSQLSGPDGAAAGTTVTIRDTTKNQGGTTAAASVTRYYYSVDNVYQQSDAALGSRAVPSLAAGASHAGSARVTVPGGIGKGRYYVLARADGEGSVVESIETNNTRAIALVGAADLRMTALTVPPTAARGQTIAVTDTTFNAQGTAGPSTTRYFLSRDLVLGSSDPVIGARNVPTLNAGARSTARDSVVIPSGTAPGRYYVIAQADAGRVVLETSDANNTLGKALTIGPDLVVAALTVSTSPVPRGGTLRISDSIRNVGAAPAGASTTRYYLSTNQTFGGDVLLGNRPIGGLAAGATSTRSTSLVIPAGTKPGAYYVIAVSDANRTVAEGNETNNTRAAAVRVS